MTEEDLLKKLSAECTIQDLQDEDGSLAFLVEAVGLDRTIEICMKLSGLVLYIPKRVERRLKAKYVMNHYDGRNARSLALMMDVTERTVYRWASLRQEVAGVSQTSLFEEDES